MNSWERNASQRLMDLARLPTVAQEAKFSGACPGWAFDRAETFAQAAGYLQTWLSAFADAVALQGVTIDGQTLNDVWARVPGRDSSRAVLLEGHYDVVALGGDFSPSLSADGLEVVGRGTCDMKGGLVTGILALEEMVRAGHKPRVDTYVLASCEEEVAAQGIQAFLQQKPPWTETLEFAIVLEPTFEAHEFEVAVRHPGDATLVMSVAVVQSGAADDWFEVRIVTGETPHASREPVYFDPNFALIQALHRLPGAALALIESDRPMDKEANALSGWSRALIGAGVGEGRIREACEEAIQAVLDGMVDDARRQVAQDRLKLEIVAATGSRPGFAVGDFVERLIDLKRQATDPRYANELYGRTPFTVAVLDVREGMARAKLDVRTDDRLYTDLPQLVAADRFPGWSVDMWNDPGLEQPGIEDNPRFQRFLCCCRAVLPDAQPAPHSGWTEAALLSKGLRIPAVIAGPGRTEWAHKQGERIGLAEMRAVYSILQDFLS